MIYKLAGNIKEKIGFHQGVYTRSYQIARAIFDAKIRNWEITLVDNLFHVKDSDDNVEKVYLELNKIQNCSCFQFVENQSGTCMHIEAVRMLHLQRQEYPKVRPIVFVDANFNIQASQRGAETNPNCFKTPTVDSLYKFRESIKLPTDSTEVSDVEVFTEQGITLFPFQKYSIQFMLKNMKTILVLRMGLGKTICALAATKILKKQKVIIVSPNSLKLQWQKEIDRFNLGSSIVIQKGSDLSRYTDQRFVILSYEMLNSNRALLDNKFDILIADEIQKIKNRESETWKTVSKISADYIFALSGTPIQNSIDDLLSLINFLNPKELKPEWKFYEQYCNCTRARVLGIKSERVSELRAKLGRYIVNPKIDYSKFKLPAKNETVITTALNDQQQAIHDDNFDSARTLIAKSLDNSLSFAERIMLNAFLTRARMAATDARLFDPANEPSARFLKIQEKIKELAEAGKKVVVYSEWIKTLHLLTPFLESNNIGFVEFHGDYSATKRNKALNKFIEDPDTKVFLSTDTGGAGIDGLQFVCNHVIHIEKIWNPMKIEQRNGRLIRTLQKEEVVNVYRFESDSDIEAMMSQNHERKNSVIADMLK